LLVYKCKELFKYRFILRTIEFQFLPMKILIVFGTVMFVLIKIDKVILMYDKFEISVFGG